MGWLTSLPSAVKISEERYFETRVDPDDATENQIRKREVVVREYRGVILAVAETALTGYPVVDQYSKISRSFAAIGGGGYTITEVIDQSVEGWIPDPANT